VGDAYEAMDATSRPDPLEPLRALNVKPGDRIIVEMDYVRSGVSGESVAESLHARWPDVEWLVLDGLRVVDEGRLADYRVALAQKERRRQTLELDGWPTLTEDLNRTFGTSYGEDWKYFEGEVLVSLSYWAPAIGTLCRCHGESIIEQAAEHGYQVTAELRPDTVALRFEHEG
jgi:hypothetical protein